MSTVKYNDKDGLLLDTFEPTVKMSSYLVAFVLSEFASKSTNTKEGVQVNYHISYSVEKGGVFCSK